MTSSRSNYVAPEMVRRPNGFGVALVRRVAEGRYEPLPVYEAPDGTLWFAARAGDGYGIEFFVPDFARYKAVTSVDGRSIMTGAESTGGPDERGWVIDKPSRVGGNVIAGWYRDQSSVAEFFFANHLHSYDELMGGSGKNLGVVGCRFYYERRPEPVYRGGGLECFGGGMKGVGTRGLGTGYGQQVEFNSSTTEFRVDLSRSAVEVVIRYAEEHELIRLGFKRLAPVDHPAAAANPFPAAAVGCPAPPGWRGGK